MARAAHDTARILLIEDTASLRMVYRAILSAAGYSVTACADAVSALTTFRNRPSPIVLLDLVLPDREGMDLMREIIAEKPDTRVIVMTAHGSVGKAVDAMRAGAHDFLVKPIEEVRLLAAIANASVEAPLRSIINAGGSPLPAAGPAARAFIGSSDTMRRIQIKIESIAHSMATVFITGESGTGKELAALAVHGCSARADGPFIALNCGAIPQDLLESEVFGHMKGSFTGAISDKPGAAQAADGGTLFLDEICEMAPALQTKLLRFLQTSTVVPVGSTKPRKVNVRIVCATNRDPMDAIHDGQFREDLFYRLYVIPVHMPPLRERGDDMIEIAETALERFGQEEGRHFDGLAPEVQSLFRRLPWPGNVRQLLNVIRNVVVLNPGGVVTPAMLPDALFLQDGVAISARPPKQKVIDSDELPEALINRPLIEIERLVIEAVLARNGGSVPRAARVLELSPSTLYRKLESWGWKR